MPIAMNVKHTRIGGGHLLHLLGDAANFVAIRPLHSKLNRPASRRTKEQPVHPDADARKIGGENFSHPADDGVAVLGIFGQDEQLREVLVLQLLVERQEEAGNTGANEGCDRTNVLFRKKALFKADRLSLRLPVRRAFRQPEVG